MTTSATELVFSIAHEVGNHLGAIRLQAHLLDEDLSALELARASVLIDGLSATAGPLLALLRPLLTEEDVAASGRMIRWQQVLTGVVQQLLDDGTQGTELVLEPLADSSAIAPDVAWLHPLLVALVGATIAHAGASARVALKLEEQAGGAWCWILDDGEEEPLGADAASRGRALVVAIASCLLERAGGRVEAERVASQTRVGLFFAKIGE
jgi:K+-sensing histidine kinase KdpD